MRHCKLTFGNYLGACFVFVACIFSDVSSWANDVVLSADFDAKSDSLAAIFIAERAGADSAQVYHALDRAGKAQFLDRFWQSHNPVLLDFYYGYHLGRRYLTVSDAFFERGSLIPRRYKTDAVAPSSEHLKDAVEACNRILADDPDDLVAKTALGYCLLEQRKGVVAEQIFVAVLEVDRKYLPARHGRALACLVQRKRVRRALDFFQATVSLDKKYEAAVYNMAMCHLAMRSVDMDHHFNYVIKRFPEHHDAYFKLGAFYESLHYFDKSVEALSKQVAINPAHRVARGRLARVAMELKYLKQELHTSTELKDLVQRDPYRYLPLLATQYFEAENYDLAATTFSHFLTTVPERERVLYDDITLLLSGEELQRLNMAGEDERRNFIALFWRKEDPTPTTPVNERKLEHYRRVHYAIQNFSEGRFPWDARGDVYVRFGHPDHRSWSDRLVFETDAKVIRVKNRLMDLARNALHEVVPSGASLSAETFSAGLSMSPEVRGMPVFPLPHQGSVFRDGASLNSKWETWVYANIGEGFEVTFHDALGDYDYQFPQPPINSPNYLLWQHMAPAAVVSRVITKTPSVYHYRYEGEPIPLYLALADFEGEERNSRLDAFVGVPWTALATQKRGERYSATLKRTMVLFDETGTEIKRDSLEISASQGEDIKDEGVLWVDQVTTQVKPGHYFMAMRVQDPVSGRLQIYRQDVDVESYIRGGLMVSDLAVAGEISELDQTSEGKFIRGDLEVLPLPSHTFDKDQPVYMYYELYNLFRDETGQTHYRVDYVVEGGQKNAGARLLRGVGNLLGKSDDKEGVMVSYEHRGDSETEPVYVALDISAKKGQQLTIGVKVTDLNRPGKPTVTKDVDVAIGDD